MGKYSSESKNEKRDGIISSKIRSRHRSSSSDSSNSRSKRRRDKKSTRRSRSRSRYRYSKSRRSRSRSTSNYRTSKSKSHKSHPRENWRYRGKDRHRSRSKDRYRSRRSRSRDYIKEYLSKPKKYSSSSCSSSDSSTKVPIPKDCKNVGKSGSSSSANATVSSRKSSSPDCVTVDSKVLDEIIEDKFTPKQYSSSKSTNVPDNILIDLKKNTIKVPEVEPSKPDSIFSHSLFLNEEARMEKWIKELYCFRQKARQQGLKSNR